MNKERPREEILARLRRIEGQIQGLQKMVTKRESCADIMIQLAAVTSAIKRVGAIVIQDYMEECLEKSQKETRGKKGTNLKELSKAIARYIDWS